MTAATPPRKRGARAEVPVTREAIVEAAFDLIEDRGFDSFSMRSLATELGVFPATLYWHVGDRGQLLGLVEEKWTLQIELPDDLDDWSEWMRELGRRYRRNAHAHPHVARLISVERVRNINAMRIPDAVLGKVAELGLGADMVHAYNALVGAVQGFVVMELARIADPDEPSARATEQEIRTLDAEQFPNITAHLDQVADHALSVRWSDGIQNPLDESFEFLLDVLLAGITARVTKKRR
jgi:TetR/AcrR family tetracycline transcriptional repressor